MTRILKVTQLVEIKNDINAFTPFAKRYSKNYGLHLLAILELINDIMILIDDVKNGRGKEHLKQDIDDFLIVARDEICTAQCAIEREQLDYEISKIFCSFGDSLQLRLKASLIEPLELSKEASQ